MQTSCYTVDRRKPSAILSMAFMLLSAMIRLIYYPQTDMTPTVFWIYLILPLAAVAVFLFTLLVLGKRNIALTALSVLFGVVFFIVKAFTFESTLHTTLCIVLYLAVLSLYSLTVFDVIRIKYLLYPLFALPLLYHIFVEDMQIYILAEPPVPFFEWLPEISVLCIMAALLCISIAMQKTPKNAHQTERT